MAESSEDSQILQNYKTKLKSSSSPNFEDILRSYTFVDKSGLILAVLRQDRKSMVLCTAPRRFGKTVNLTMMQRFLELEVDENGKEKVTTLEKKNNYRLFTLTRYKLKVMENKMFVTSHFGQYPIINISFLCCYDVKSESDAVMVCKKAIRRAYREHMYLYLSKLSPLEDNEKKVCQQWCNPLYVRRMSDATVVEGLALLAVFLNKFHNRKVFLLVDEYDSIILNALYNVKNVDQLKELEELEGAAKFPIKVIGCALKNYAEFFQGAFITGILNVGDLMISNLLENVMRRQFGTRNLCQDFYGFNEEEVRALFIQWGVDEQLKKKALDKYNSHVNGASEPLYNPYCIVQFLHNLQLGEGALQNYWHQSGFIEHVNKLLKEDGTRSLLNELLQDVKHFVTNLKPLDLSNLKLLHNLLIHSNLTCNVEVVVKFLVSLGYLTYSVKDYKLKIPNSELIEEFTELLLNYFFERYGINRRWAEICSQSFSKLAHLCDEGNTLGKFKAELTNFRNNINCLLQHSVLTDPLNEATLKAVMSSICPRGGFLFGNDLIIPHYRTKVDVILYNNTFGGIVQIKCDPQTSKDALRQIFMDHCCNVFTMRKYFSDRQKSPYLSFVMGMHVDSKKEAYMMCLRRKDILEVLHGLTGDVSQSIETCIDVAIHSRGKYTVNAFLDRAIGA